MSWKKSLSVTSQEKNCLFLPREKKNALFSLWTEKNNLIRKKNHTPPPGIKWSAPYVLYSPVFFIQAHALSVKL